METKNANPIMEELKLWSELEWMDKPQREFFVKMYHDAKPVKVSSVNEVFSSDEIQLIKDVVAPKKHQCYRNALLLAELFPDKCKYVEGFGYGKIIRVEHAFNRIGDKYVDITWEMVLNDDTQTIPYVSLIEADFDEVCDDLTKHGNITGEYYRHKYIEALEARQ